MSHQSKAMYVLCVLFSIFIFIFIFIVSGVVTGAKLHANKTFAIDRIKIETSWKKACRSLLFGIKNGRLPTL